MENTGATLTGKASVDKPWLQFYPEALRNVEVPTITVETFLRAKNPDENKIAFEYYGNDRNEVEAKLHEIEHQLYPEAINIILKTQKKIIHNESISIC